MTKQEREKGGVVIFDGWCNLCSSSVDFVIRNDREKRFRFVAIQSEAGQELLRWMNEKANAETLLLFRGGKLYRYSEAALLIARDLRFPWNLLRGLLIIPPFLRDPVYRFIAARRFRWFGRRESCRVVSSGETGHFLTPEEVTQLINPGRPDH